jgi:TonB-dependent receptor
MLYRYIRNCLKVLSGCQFLAFILILLLSANLVNAQSGRIQGKVIDAKDNDPLPGASVFFEGTVIGTATSIEGVYSISNVKPGKYNLVASYVGYENKVIPVTIVANKTVTLDITLSWNSKAYGKEIVVMGQLEGQAQAINQQRVSDQIVNVVSEERIKELPDANAAEAAGRLPGVAVQRDGGEASKLMIRGLDPKFLNVTLNGIEVPASDADNRSVDLSMFSQSSLSGIELYKALTPDQDGDALAGSINLISGQAKAGQKLSLSGYGIYNGVNKNAEQYKTSGQYSNRFFSDFLGVQAEVSAEKRDRSDQTFSNSWTIPGNLDYTIGALTVGVTDETRKRFGGSLNLDINTDDGGNIKLINSYNKTSRTQFIGSRNYVTGGNSVSYTGEVVDKETYTFNNSLVGENHFEGAKINWAVSHAYTRNNKPFDVQMQFNENQTTYSGMKTINSTDVLKSPGADLIPYAWNNFSQSQLYSSYFYQDVNNERNYEGKFDVEYPIRLNDNLDATIKGGYKFRDKIRHRSSNEWYAPYLTRSSTDYTDENGQIVAKNWAASPWASDHSGVMTDFFYGDPTRTIDKLYTLNPVLNADLIRGWYNFNKNGVSQNGKYFEYVAQIAAKDRGNNLQNSYNTTEGVNATYLMTKINAGSFITILGGVRYEYESNSYNTNYIPRIIGENETQTAIIIDTTSKYHRGYVLPNLHIKLQPYDWWDVKLAVSKSISRPDYSMRLPTLYIENEAQSIMACNPNLQTAVAWNFDASTSLYSSQFGLLTISGFKKNIDNMFYWLNDVKIMSAQQARDLGLPVDKYGPLTGYTATLPVNTQGTQVWGTEVELQTHLGFLPGLLQNIVIGANYTRIWSKTQYPRYTVKMSGLKANVIYYTTTDDLNGQTDYIGNASAGYDYKGFSGRVSVNFQGKYLASVSALAYQDVYQKPFSRWDLALKQVITDNLTAFLNVNNFTNTIEGSYVVFKNLDNGGYLYGVTADLGIQVTLF